VNLPIAGGGYFRILPYAWTQWGIRRLNYRERQSAFFYLHPWEIDPRQPRVPAGTLSRFRHYCNLDQTESRLRALVAEFTFAPVASVVSHLLDRVATPTRHIVDSPIGPGKREASA
jgi:hypothetical protein